MDGALTHQSAQQGILKKKKKNIIVCVSVRDVLHYCSTYNAAAVVIVLESKSRYSASEILMWNTILVGLGAIV